MSFIWAAIGLGFVSSFHCIGMCGPIALALPIGKVNPLQRLFFILIYNLGRIFTYALLGALFGILGSSLVIGSFQNTVSITIGLFLMASVFFGRNALQNSLNNSLFGFFNAIKSGLSKLFSKNTKSSILFIGLLNGLLPCGMVYLAIAGAVTTGSFVNGALFMFFFGIGTFSIMLTLPLFGNLIGQSFRKQMQKISPAFKVGMAALLILRGLNLGIPYISPESTEQNGIVCHVDESTNKAHPLILCAKPKTVINEVKKP